LGSLIARIYFLIKIKSNRKAAVLQSRNVVLGHVNEKIAPLLPNFPYHYKDLMFLGKGVDYLVFDGMSSGNLKKIVFLEIKTGVSGLNRNEQMIKNCLTEKRVSYEVWRSK
jgi:predicted Holliday junction resolvase-like endonuclease